jgi:UTP--glucose-1-phosphate uridylyltransferase
MPVSPSTAHDAAIAKLVADGAGESTIAAFRARLEALADPDAGALPGDRLRPLPDLPALDDLAQPSPEVAHEVLDRLVVLKLNGGLGTSMGLSAPKSSIEIKDGHTFLDVVATQVLALRERHGVRLPLVLMDSATTRGPSLAILEQHPDLAADVPPDFLQSREPKLLADTHEPVSWPVDPALEWCPAGHGDVYVSLESSGMLDELLDAGYHWAFVSNVDNLGALVDARIATWMAEHEIPFVMEVVRGTAADRKGGHLGLLDDGRVVLRETAQVPDGDASFGEVDRWRWYNTNDLWIDLRALKALLAEHPAGPPLPLIVNRKTVDPTDPSSPAVLQLETAMGAAIGAIDGARALHVPRTRFAPVKTTDDLLLVRSDAYVLGSDGVLEPAFAGDPPFIALDPEHYKLLDSFEERFPDGAPHLRGASALRVEGDVRFGAGVTVEGDVTVHGPQTIPDGAVLRG